MPLVGVIVGGVWWTRVCLRRSAAAAWGGIGPAADFWGMWG